MLEEFIRKADAGFSYTSVPITKLSIGADVGLAVTLLKGNQDGPTLYVGAAIHGRELNGIGVIFEVLRSIQPSDLKGKIICVPVQNPVAFQHRVQFIPGEVYDSPQGNPYAACPGSPSGQLSERTADAILKVVKHADCVVDLHTGNDFIDHAFCFFSENECADRARKLARMFGTSLVTEATSGAWVTNNMFLEAVNQMGIPAFGAELGQTGVIEPESVETGYRGICNVLKALGMIAGEITKNPDQIVVDKIVPVRASTGGIYRHSVKLGTWVKKGDEMAKVYDLHLREIETIRSPASGIVHSQKTYLTVNAGERVSLVGVPMGGR